MLTKFIKYILILILFQNPLYSKSKTFNDLNSRYLSNYFSGMVAYDNQDNFKALRFFQSSKILIKEHNPYLEKYVYSLVLEGRVQQAANEIIQNSIESNSNFFEAHLILSLNSLKKKNYKKSREHLKNSLKFINNDRLALIVGNILNQYLYVFEEKKIPNTKNKYGNFSFINEVFQRCYLNDKNTKSYFQKLINLKDDPRQESSNYSRYIFFYINYLIQDDKYYEAKEISDDIDYLNSSLLISQGKKWIENQKQEEFKKLFSCKNSNDVVSEFLFLVANLYSTQEDYEKSNFYLNIAHYLNPKFKFNLALLAENHFINKDYSKTLKTLKNFNKKNEFYYWFKIKKEAQIISKQKGDEVSMNFISSNFKKIQNPSIKTVFDVANFNKNAKRYKVAIGYYDQILSKINTSSKLYAEILYRRGGSYERLASFENSDSDLLKSLEIDPDNSYVLNYLAYSWLERKYKINIALEMLERAYAEKSNDPYIIDSIGWAYYLIKDYTKAENFLRRAVELMPEDPIVNDHYGDILWKLDRKIQARYFWESVLSLEETEDDMKIDIRDKLIRGLQSS